MSRVLALVGAICLIAAAIIGRALLTDDDGDGGDSGGDDGDGLVVACIPELREACEAIDRPIADLFVEDPGATIARIADGQRVDAWITFDPWPEMAGLIERRATFDVVEPVAATDLLLVAQTSAADSSGCDELLTWTCLVDELGDAVAIPAVRSAVGALVAGQAATDFFGGPFASNDFAEPALADRLGALDVQRDPLGDIRLGFPEPAATGALEVDLASLGSRSVVVGPSAAPATVAVVVAGPDADRVAGEPSFTEALAELGWDVSDDAATTGLPDAGVLVALQGAVR